MTESSTTVIDRDIDAPSEIFPIIDRAIKLCSGRDLVSASEMIDILLDLRMVVAKEGII